MASKFKITLTLASVALVVGLATALPNIRIQVNNENIKNAPYLLEASKRQELLSLQNHEAPTNDRQPSSPAAPISQISSLSPATEAASENNQDDNTGGGGGGVMSVLKEETIEEILDLDSMKLSPPNLISSANSAFSDSQQSVAPAQDDGSLIESAAAAAQPDAINSNHNEPLTLHTPHDNNGPSNGGRKPASQQLPVANSHLKKPATFVSDPSADDNTGNVAGGGSATSGAKSLVSPTILHDAPSSTETGDDKLLKKKANGQQPPDVWEPNQVMSGVSNVSLVPAIINRDYGSQTRTRVTLGGGYQRDRQPAVEDPTSGSSSSTSTLKQSTHTNSANSKNNGDSDTGSFSHLVEVPERIVLPASVLSSQQPAKQQAGKPTIIVAMNNSSSSSTGVMQPPPPPPPGRKQKLDSRCPKQGVMTFEHPSACDRYFYCEDGSISEQTCPNGLLYGVRDTVLDYCVHRWKAACEDKAIPNPISSPGCRWQYGIFSVQGSPKCTPDFYECTEGRFEVRKCSIDGQVYDDRTKSCQYSEAVGCTQEALGDFQCPPDDQGNTYWPFPRYFLNERALIHCVNDKPEIVRCTSDERVDPEHLHCVPVGKLQAKSHSSSSSSGSSSGSGSSILDVPAERRAREKKKQNVSSSSRRRRR